MSGNPPTLTQPVSAQDFDADLARVAALVIGDTRLLQEMADWALNILTTDNLAGGMLVRLGGAGTVPLTQAEYDQYRLFFAQVQDIAQRWSAGSTPATGLVQPWLRTFAPTTGGGPTGLP